MPENIIQEFLDETVFRLNYLYGDLIKNRQEISEENLRSIFRLTHTVKGNSQIFNLKNISRFAAEFENLLQSLNNGTLKQNPSVFSAVAESLNQLLILCKNPKAIPDKDLISRIKSLLPQNKPLDEDNSAGEIPQKFLSKLSAGEKILLNNSLENGKDFYSIEAFFPLSDFGEPFKNLRKSLEAKGSVIAVLPSETPAAPQEIGFTFYFAGSENPEKYIESFNAKSVFSTARENDRSAADLKGILKDIAAKCKKFAEETGKKIDIEISADDSEISVKNILPLKDIVIHLLHNAVDHAIETPEKRVRAGKNPHGKIHIGIRKTNDQIILKIRDNGRGINAEAITAKARKNGLIPKDKTLTETEAAEFIFTHGFSTADSVSKISGRGVGLGAVKNEVDLAGGKIFVKSTIGQETEFEIRLPQAPQN